MDYNIERENNIIKNIAKEIVIECAQNGFEITRELADYVVKLKLLSPKNGFTASEVMPRSQTQQLVMLVVEDLKQDTPGMNCIRMQVFWDSVKMNLADLKKEYSTLMSEKTEPYVSEILTMNRDETSKFLKNVTVYVLAGYNLGSISNSLALKETQAAAQSVLTHREMDEVRDLPTEQLSEKIKEYAKIIAGVRLYLKYLGKAGDGVQDVHDLVFKIEMLKSETSSYLLSVLSRIEEIQEVIDAVVPMDFFLDVSGIPQRVENLPPDCEESDLIYLKKILALMVQHSMYLSDILSKLDEMDGDVSFFLKGFEETLQNLKNTVRDRDAVPTTEVFPEFEKATELWMEIEAYVYSFEIVQNVVLRLESINKKEYFARSVLEKALNLPPKTDVESDKNKKLVSSRRFSQGTASSGMLREGSEEFPLEFAGYCAWTLYYIEGFLVPGNKESGIHQYKDKYYAFSGKFGLELWKRDPEYCLMEIYEYLRNNPELVGLLNAYENLYNTKSTQLVKTVERKVATRSDIVQTVLHPVEDAWDKDYTFSLWELKKRALALSRMVKCVTKSVQTESPHSNFRASIGIHAAPDKDKEVQTTKESYCNHSTIANYLYGLRGHKEDKFKVLELTRPVEENCEKVIVLEEGDPCRQQKETQVFFEPFITEPCQLQSSDDPCDDDYYYYYEDSNYTDDCNT